MLIKQNIDKDWFLGRLEENNRSVRGLARHMEIDPSAVSRMLSGERRMKMDEANLIAQFLGVHVRDVLKHAGVAIDLDGQPTRILLVGTIDTYGEFRRLKEPKALPQTVIDRAHAAVSGMGNTKIIAAQIRAEEGPLAMLDDAVVLFRHTDTVDPGVVGSLVIGRSNDGKMGMSRVIRARKTGEMVCIAADEKTYEREAVMSTPIIAIIP